MNRELLKKVIEDSGLPKTVIAKRMGIKYRALVGKCDGTVQWKVDEAQRFCDVLRLTSAERNKIFFCT